MATTTDVGAGVQMIALERIRHDNNVRDVAAEDVAALAGSIALLGQITPVIVRPDGDGYLLVAGHKRYAALRHLGRTEIRAEIHSQEAEHSERAAENIVRTQLDAYQEAQAVAAMLANGLSDDALRRRWAGRRPGTARMRLLELPEAAEQMVGAGQIALGSVEQLARWPGPPELLDALIAYLVDGNEWAAERLAREPGWVLDAALRETSATKVFAAHLGQVDGYELRAQARQEDRSAVRARRRADPPADRYPTAPRCASQTRGRPGPRRRRVIEFDRGYPLIVDRALYRELVKQAIARTVTSSRSRSPSEPLGEGQPWPVADQPADTVADARREEQRQLASSQSARTASTSISAPDC